jgi:hypothetical protein
MSRIGHWLREHPTILEKAYRLTHRIVHVLEPGIKRLNIDRVERFITPPEEWAKKLIFDCQMCGQCILHSTGMTCPMTCPKNLRNGPCGGVRTNGHCEVKPEMRCVWVEAFERSEKMKIYSGEMRLLQPPVNRELGHRSAWITMITGEDQHVASGWE